MHTKEKEFKYDIGSSKKDKVSGNCLLFSHALSEIINLFVSTFLIAYIHSLSDGIFKYIFNVGIYNIMTYAVMIVVYLVVSYFIQKTNRVWFYRLGAVLRTCLVILVIFFGKDIAKMLYLAGALNGMSLAIYWAAYNVIRQEMVSRNAVKGNVVLTNVLSSSIKLVVPVVMGAIIEVSSYTSTSMYVLVVCLIQIALSFGIHSRRPSGSEFNLGGYFRKIKQYPEFAKRIKHLYLSYFAFGFSSIIADLITVCTMLQLGSSLSLGILTSVFGAVSILTLLLFHKFTKPAKRSPLIITLIFCYVVSGIVFVSHINLITLIVFQGANTIYKVVIDTIGGVYRNSNLKEAGLYSEIDEHQATIEMIIETTRIVTFSLLLLTGLIGNLIIFKVLLMVFILGYSLWGVGLFFYEKKYALTPLKSGESSSILNEENTKVEKEEKTE